MYKENIENDRIRLRLIEEKDIEQLRLWRNNVRNSKYFFDNSFISSESQKQWFQCYLSNDRDLMFMIEEKDSSDILGFRPIGMAAIYHIDYKRHEAEIGRFLLGEELVRGKGLGFSTVSLVCDYARRYLKLEKLYLEVVTSNTIAIKTYSKAGFVEVGQMKVNGKQAFKMEKTLEVEKGG